ncbi:MAG TPA: tRNA (adenosine(37)-N6)-dimethylallyltransferase MiaA [Rhizomicrobium sp.]|jgi:tRNA dimethylallyltransferase|nr:tRNA (adenosine(37)-N6)-dimethylallyltransferase MiaA [Rhizomicrobium sp.]
MNSQSSVDAVLIAGPTASGKSAVAHALARAIDGVVINADSMQVYRETRILTARPTDEDTSTAPHFLYGHVSVTESYSAGRYQAEAAHALRTARESGRVPIFCGGTGMYFGVLTEGIANIPAVPAGMREQVRQHRDAIGADAFHIELATRDPESAARLRASDTQRTLRAYEVFEATGRPLSEWQKEMGEALLGGLNLARFVLSPPRDELHKHIDARFDTMLAAGAREEARALEGIALSATASKIIGLRELQAVEEGAQSLEEGSSRAKTATRQYAKRQLTWFRRRMAEWNWLEVQELSNILPLLSAQLNENA